MANKNLVNLSEEDAKTILIKIPQDMRKKFIKEIIYSLIENMDEII